MTRLVSIPLVVAALGCGDNRPQAARVDDAGITVPGAEAGTEPNPNMQPPAPLLACTPSSGTQVSLRRVAFGCGEPKAPSYPACIAGVSILATAPVADPRLFVLEQTGAIRIIDDNTLHAPSFLDLSAEAGGPVLAGGEMGLLGLAFHPDYATNRKFYVDFTGSNPDKADTSNPFVDVVMEFTASTTDPNLADPASGKIVLSIPDFAGNHNGGMIEFGSDGFLYVATGDGGGAGDPARNGQNKHALLGKMLRIDVDHPGGGKPYGIPAGNPFADGTAGAPEVFVVGLRNPWRWSFDRKNGDMWIADVGQNQIEELDVLIAGQQAGKNLGWSAFEGDRCCASPTSDGCSQGGTMQQACDAADKFMPQFQVEHAQNWDAIIGGQVYRGSCFPDLDGVYFFSDNLNRSVDEARMQGDGSLTITMLPGEWPISPASIHADSRGELFETNTSGGVWLVEAH